MDKVLLTCEDCKIISVEVRTIVCPYASEIQEEYVWANLCPACERERARDI